MKTFDPAILTLSKPDMIRLGQGMMDMIKSYNPEILAGAAVNRIQSKVEFANSAGAAIYGRTHRLRGGRGRAAGARYGYPLCRGQHPPEAAGSRPEEIAERAINYFRMAESIAPIQTGEIPGHLHAGRADRPAALAGHGAGWQECAAGGVAAGGQAGAERLPTRASPWWMIR